MNALISLLRKNQFWIGPRIFSEKNIRRFYNFNGFLPRKVKRETFSKNRTSRMARREHGNWCPLSTSLPAGRGEEVARARGLCACLNWLGTVLDIPDYSYRAAMPRARAPFPHSSDDPVPTPPSPLLVLFLFRLIRTHTRARTAHTRLINRSLCAEMCIYKNYGFCGNFFTNFSKDLTPSKENWEFNLL